MTDYDALSVHDLVLLASHDGAMQQHFKRKIPSDLPAIETAIRKAVIREAAIKTEKKLERREAKKRSQEERRHWLNDSYPN